MTRSMPNHNQKDANAETMEGKAARSASSPANPVLHMLPADGQNKNELIALKGTGCELMALKGTGCELMAHKEIGCS